MSVFIIMSLQEHWKYLRVSTGENNYFLNCDLSIPRTIMLICRQFSCFDYMWPWGKFFKIRTRPVHMHHSRRYKKQLQLYRDADRAMRNHTSWRSVTRTLICDPGPQNQSKGQFFEIEIYTSSDRWMSELSLMYGLLGYENIWLRYNYLKIWNLRVQKNLNIEKITFKVVQMKFLAMHITNQKLSFVIFTVGNLQNIMEHDLYLIS